MGTMSWYITQFLAFVCTCVHAPSLSPVRLFAIPWTVARQAPLSMRILQGRMLEWVATSSSRTLVERTAKLWSPEWGNQAEDGMVGEKMDSWQCLHDYPNPGEQVLCLASLFFIDTYINQIRQNRVFLPLHKGSLYWKCTVRNKDHRIETPSYPLWSSVILGRFPLLSNFYCYYDI